MPANKTTSDGNEYGPTAKGKMYLSINKHRGCGSLQHKSTWAILPDLEYEIFCSSDDNFWHDEKNNYWGVSNQGQTLLGKEGERICKFPCPTNDSDFWHGYPTFSYRKGDAPPDSLVQAWIEQNIVRKETGRKIQKLKI
jgi:hypothetical protein